MTDRQVSFPAPCSEPWEAMAPAGCNRHCAACDKVIHDLAAMTLPEVEQLVAAGEEVCVRARIAPDGVIALKESKGGARRKLVAAVGASMTLAAAACQTPMVGPVSPRYAISGETWGWYHSRAIRLVSETGKELRPVVGQDTAFRFTNLRPGTYTPQYVDFCGDVHKGDPITITNADITLGKIDLAGGEECIIVGVMVPLDDWRG